MKIFPVLVMCMVLGVACEAAKGGGGAGDAAANGSGGSDTGAPGDTVAGQDTGVLGDEGPVPLAGDAAAPGEDSHDAIASSDGAGHDAGVTDEECSALCDVVVPCGVVEAGKTPEKCSQKCIEAKMTDPLEFDAIAACIVAADGDCDAIAACYKN